MIYDPQCLDDWQREYLARHSPAFAVYRLHSALRQLGTDIIAAIADMAKGAR